MYLLKVTSLFGILSLGWAFPQDLIEQVLFQSVRPDIQKKIDELKNLMKNEVEPILSAVDLASLQLKGAIADIEAKKASLEERKKTSSTNLSKLPGDLSGKLLSRALSEWSFNSCGDFTEDCLTAAKLISKGTVVAVKMGVSSANIITDVLNCPSLNVFRAYQCYSRNIDAVKELLVFANTEAVPLIQQARALSKQIYADFEKCTGMNSGPQTNLVA